MTAWGKLLLLTLMMLLSITQSGCAQPPITPDSATKNTPHSIVLANTQTLYYRSAGTALTSTPILLIHGIPDASDSWLPIMTQLARSHPVYAVDLAGYGYSDWPAGHDLSLSAQAGYVGELLDRLKINKVIVVGHDIGGGIAQILAVHHPQRVIQLVLINSAIGAHWPVIEMHMLRLPWLGPATFTLLETPIWSYMLHKGFYRDELLTADTVQRYRHWYQGASGRERLVRNARALDNTNLTGLSPPPATLQTATLVLWGREDRFLAAAPAQQLCQSMLHCRFEFIDAAGHFVLDEQPDRIAERIAYFIHGT